MEIYRVFTLRFTRTITRCATISAIKFMEAEKREFSSTFFVIMLYLEMRRRKMLI